MKIYISGAISSLVPGVDRETLKARFHDAEFELVISGHEVVNPLSVKACDDQECVKTEIALRNPQGGDFEVPYNEHTWACWMRYDIMAMLECDAIYLLKDWQHSRGAQLEFQVATTCGLEVMFQ